MSKKQLIKFLLIPFLFLSTFYITFAVSDSVQINLNVNNCNNDNICDTGEDFASCPADCPASCNNNNVCESSLGEDIANCPADCTPPPVCNNNNVCDLGEDILNCPADCAILPPVCNNNSICESGETVSNCPSDCVIIPPNPQPKSTVTGSFVYVNFFKNLNINVSYDSATIKWTSNFPTTSILKWGTNLDYKDGTISSIEPVLNHKIEIINLKEGTTYFFRIDSEDYFGRINSLPNQFFVTLSTKDNIPPGNPTNVKASSNPYGITVSWKNPNDADFDYVRVMRNSDRYYGSPLAGNLVYEGRGSYFNDTKVKSGVKYFYSLFSRDKAGNYSSGSLVNVTHIIRDGSVVTTPSDNKGGEVITKEPEPAVPGVTYSVIQDSSFYDFKIGNILNLNGDDSIKVKTNYPSSSKDDDIWVEITDYGNSVVGRYFFSRNRDKDGFTIADIPPFDKGGYYNISIYRYSHGFTRIINQGSFEISKASEGVVDEPTEDHTFWYFIFVVFFLIPMWWLVVILHRRFRENKIDNNI